MNTPTRVVPLPLPLPVDADPGDSESQVSCEPEIPKPLVFGPAQDAQLRLSAGKLTTALRWLGAITLATAAICYLIGNWMEASPLIRFYTFLGFTAFLGAAGVYCGIGWREDKGARTFVGISALFVPPCFAQMGALVHAEWQGTATAFPEQFRIFQYGPVGWLGLAIALSAGAIVLAPLTFLAFSSLARPEAKRLTFAYLAGNAALLLPIRDPNAIAPILGSLLIFLGFTDLRFFGGASGLKHWDGVAVRTAMWLPPTVLAGRTVLLHGSSPILDGLLLAILAALLFAGVPRYVSNRSLQTLARLASLVPLSFSWLNIIDPVLPWFDRPTEELIVPLKLLPLTGIVVALSFHAPGSAAFYRRSAAFVAMGGLLYQLMVYSGTSSSVLCATVAVTLIAGAFWLEDRSLFCCGTIGFLISIGYHIVSARDFWADNLWVSLAVLGVLIVLASSLIERQWQVLRARGRAFLDDWSSWS